MILNQHGDIVRQEWLMLETRFTYIVLHEFIIMPNHVHGIIEIKRDNPDVLNLAPPIKTGNKMYDITQRAGSLSNIVKAYKSNVTHALRKINSNFSWQKNYWEHIIRGNDDYQNLSTYIRCNTENWYKDKLFYEIINKS
jgi:REP element-mobilizing transposase RayT